MTDIHSAAPRYWWHSVSQSTVLIWSL